MKPFQNFRLFTLKFMHFVQSLQIITKGSVGKEAKHPSKQTTIDTYEGSKIMIWKVLIFQFLLIKSEL